MEEEIKKIKTAIEAIFDRLDDNGKEFVFLQDRVLKNENDIEQLFEDTRVK